MSSMNLNSLDTTEAEEQTMLPCDRRYRDSDYFQNDQLRFSEAAQDVRAIREDFQNIHHNIQSLILSSPMFSVRSAFRFQTVPIQTES